MRLTSFSDYTLHMLAFAAAAGDRLFTIEETARAFGVSRAHLNKVANTLTRAGYLTAVRGRLDGLTLGRRPQDIRIGDVIRQSETDFRLVECFDSQTNVCSLTPSCRLKHLLDQALKAYFKELDGATLADIAKPINASGASSAKPRLRSIPLKVQP